jgi:hypothetical protein
VRQPQRRRIAGPNLSAFGMATRGRDGASPPDQKSTLQTWNGGTVRRRFFSCSDKDTGRRINPSIHAKVVNTDFI